MGLDKMVKIGPYLIVNHVKTEVTKYKMVCETQICASYNKKVLTDYCPNCGARPEKIDYRAEKVVIVNNLLYESEYDNSFYFPHNGGNEILKSASILLPNKKCKNEIEIDYADEYPLYVNGDYLINPESDIISFKEEYSKELELIRNKFGEENMFFKWGIVVSYS